MAVAQSFEVVEQILYVMFVVLYVYTWKRTFLALNKSSFFFAWEKSTFLLALVNRNQAIHTLTPSIL